MYSGVEAGKEARDGSYRSQASIWKSLVVLAAGKEKSTEGSARPGVAARPGSAAQAERPSSARMLNVAPSEISLTGEGPLYQQSRSLEPGETILTGERSSPCESFTPSWSALAALLLAITS